MIYHSSDPVVYEYENMLLFDAYMLHEDGYALIVSDGKVRVEYDV